MCFLFCVLLTPTLTHRWHLPFLACSKFLFKWKHMQSRTLCSPLTSIALISTVNTTSCCHCFRLSARTWGCDLPAKDPLFQSQDLEKPSWCWPGSRSSMASSPGVTGAVKVLWEAHISTVLPTCTTQHLLLVRGTLQSTEAITKNRNWSKDRE